MIPVDPPLPSVEPGALQSQYWPTAVGASHPALGNAGQASELQRYFTSGAQLNSDTFGCVPRIYVYKGQGRRDAFRVTASTPAG